VSREIGKRDEAQVNNSYIYRQLVITNGVVNYDSFTGRTYSILQVNEVQPLITKLCREAVLLLIADR